MQQQARTRQVTQEQVTKTGAFACTFNQPRNISYNKALFGTDTHYAQMRMQRREGIVGNLGTCVAHGRNESRLSCVGHTEQADVGKHLELEAYCAVLPRLARRALARSTIDACLKVQVTQTALAAGSQKLFVAVVRQVSHRFAGGFVHNERTYRHA